MTCGNSSVRYSRLLRGQGNRAYPVENLRSAYGRRRRSTFRRIQAALLGATLAGALATLAAVAHAQEIETASIGPGSLRLGGADDIPGVLSSADEARYRRIFAVQSEGDWGAADRLIGELDSELLLGHVLFQRYMHPTAYRSSYRELRDWMAAYADHPEARRIYRLAVRRMPKGAKPPRGPQSHGAPATRPAAQAKSDLPARPKRSRGIAREVRQLKAEIRSRVRRGWPTGATKVLAGKRATKLLTAFEVDEAKALIAQGYFRAGKDALALRYADQAARHGDYLPMGHWWGGLAAWRLGRIDDAYTHFSRLAQSRHASSWNLSSGAYWASRAALASRRPAEVNRWLQIGAAHPYTFYGLLSRRALALDLDYDWSQPPLTLDQVGAISGEKLGARGLALIQIGQVHWAGLELRNLAADRQDLVGEIAALASRAKLAALTLRLAEPATPGYAEPMPALMYPLPAWKPASGFQVDRALVYAFMRQESRFIVRAQSRVGARGLMQLLPRTASFVAKQRSLRGKRKYELFDPALNMDLGQRYLDHLMDTRDVDNNLFRLAAAYNGGPGNLRKWQRETDFNDDPLLFIETLPLRETRLFIERVLTNLWVYRDRLGQPTPSLDAVVAGDWPTYMPLDDLFTAEALLAN